MLKNVINVDKKKKIYSNLESFAKLEIRESSKFREKAKVETKTEAAVSRREKYIKANSM